MGLSRTPHRVIPLLAPVVFLIDLLLSTCSSFSGHNFLPDLGSFCLLGGVVITRMSLCIIWSLDKYCLVSNDSIGMICVGLSSGCPKKTSRITFDGPSSILISCAPLVSSPLSFNLAEIVHRCLFIFTFSMPFFWIEAFAFFLLRMMSLRSIHCCRSNNYRNCCSQWLFSCPYLFISLLWNQKKYL